MSGRNLTHLGEHHKDLSDFLIYGPIIAVLVQSICNKKKLSEKFML